MDFDSGVAEASSLAGLVLVDSEEGVSAPSGLRDRGEPLLSLFFLDLLDVAGRLGRRGEIILKGHDHPVQHGHRAFQVAVNHVREGPGPASVFHDRLLKRRDPPADAFELLLGFLKMALGFPQIVPLFAHVGFAAKHLRGSLAEQVALGLREFLAEVFDAAFPVVPAVMREPVDHARDFHLGGRQRVLGIVAEADKMGAEVLDGVERADVDGKGHDRPQSVICYL